MLTDGRTPPRALICGPAFRADFVGGAQDVLDDLASGLRVRGWEIDLLIRALDFEDAPGPWSRLGPPRWHGPLGRASRALHVPESWRRRAWGLLQGRSRLRHQSGLLSRIERAIESGRYDVVLAWLDGAPIGLAALTARSHPRPVLLSLGALAHELRHSASFRAGRRAAGFIAGASVHPDLFSAVDPSRVRLAVFASGSWRDAAIDAGLPMQISRVIHFGVCGPARLGEPRPVGSPVRLLWAARVSPEKGLHFFLPAVALLRREIALRLTIVAAAGADTYRSRIERMIQQLNLSDVTDFLPAVPRMRLPGVLTSHDALLFYSRHPEPVAQMLLLAAAQGVIVVGPLSTDPRSLLSPDETAFCFDGTSPQQIAVTIRRAVTDVEMRRTVRARAFACVTREHSLEGTVAAYDALLAELMELPPGRPM